MWFAVRGGRGRRDAGEGRRVRPVGGADEAGGNDEERR